MLPAPPATRRWPRGPYNDLIRAACDGSAERTLALLSEGSIDIDQGGPEGWTPLICAVGKNYARIVRILLKEGANLAVQADEGFTALHFSVQYGHLAVTKMLLKAGAELEARTESGATPLIVAAAQGHSAIVSVLIEAGADVNGRHGTAVAETPLYTAAHMGHTDAVKILLRAGADPLLATGGSSKRTPEHDRPGWAPTPGITSVPLDIAAEYGRTEVARELIRCCGIEGCGGRTGGAFALQLAAQHRHLEIAAALTEAGVRDTGAALVAAAGAGLEPSAKALLRHRRAREPSGVGAYVDNARGPSGATAVLLAIGIAGFCSPRILRMFVDAGADTTSPVLIRNNSGAVVGCGSPMRLVTDSLANKKLGGREATEGDLHRLEAARRLLLRVDATRATSWLWAKGVAGTDAVPRGFPAAEQEASSTIALPLVAAQPVLRRRAARHGRVVLAPLFRHSAKP
eukprot:g3350.t1